MSDEKPSMWDLIRVLQRAADQTRDFDRQMKKLLEQAKPDKERK